jgi:hypothetical protein
VRAILRTASVYRPLTGHRKTTELGETGRELRTILFFLVKATFVWAEGLVETKLDSFPVEISAVNLELL